MLQAKEPLRPATIVDRGLPVAYISRVHAVRKGRTFAGLVSAEQLWRCDNLLMAGSLTDRDKRSRTAAHP